VSNLKIIENVALPILFHTTLSNNDGLKRALELLRRVGFTGDVWSLPGPLPFYKKKVVAFARAMALDPDIVICNRFLVGLDKQQRGHMLGLLDEFQKAKEGRLTILTTSEERDFAVLPLSRKYRIKEKGLRRIDE
ncbi:MAG: hypothetical protein ACE5GF_09425, partial [Thermodesulfobacteriota bacterium]